MAHMMKSFPCKENSTVLAGDLAGAVLVWSMAEVMGQIGTVADPDGAADEVSLEGGPLHYKAHRQAHMAQSTVPPGLTGVWALLGLMGQAEGLGLKAVGMGLSMQDEAPALGAVAQVLAVEGVEGDAQVRCGKD